MATGGDKKVWGWEQMGGTRGNKRKGRKGGTRRSCERGGRGRGRGAIVSPVKHGDRILCTELEAIKILQVGDGVDAATADSVVIAGDGTDEDDARVLGLCNLGEEEGYHEEVGEEVDLHLLLVPAKRQAERVRGRNSGRQAPQPIKGIQAGG